jgi:hypothetical protein
MPGQFGFWLENFLVPAPKSSWLAVDDCQYLHWLQPIFHIIVLKRLPCQLGFQSSFQFILFGFVHGVLVTTSWRPVARANQYLVFDSNGINGFSMSKENVIRQFRQSAQKNDRDHRQNILERLNEEHVRASQREVVSMKPLSDAKAIISLLLKKQQCLFFPASDDCPLALIPPTW